MIFPVSLLEEQMDDDHVTGGEMKLRKEAQQTRIFHLMQENQRNKGMVCAGPSILHYTLLLIMYITYFSYVNKEDPKLVDVDVSKVIKQLLRELRVALRN